MRVLQIGLSENIGGIETFLINLYRNIDRDQVQFDFITYADKAAFEDEILQMGGGVFHMTARRKNPLVFHKELHEVLAQHRYPVVHLHLNTASNLAPLFAAKKAQVQCRIAHAHNSSFAGSRITQALHDSHKAKLRQTATDLFACSESAADWMFESMRQVKLIRNAIDTAGYRFDKQRRETVRKELGLTDQLVIGHVGRFVKEKNHSFLIRIFEKVAKQNPNAVLLLIGVGPMQESVRRLAQAKGLTEKVRFLGQTQRVAELMQGMDVFVLPSLYEGLPFALIEAQAAGLPILSSIDTVPNITRTLHHISLEADPKYWAQRILKASLPERADTSPLLIQAGYDVARQAKLLQEFYLSRDGV